MRKLTLVISLLIAAQAAPAQDVPPLLTAKDLLLPCQEADNDPRDGYVAQLECVTFIRGFLAGQKIAGLGDAVCPPDTNTDDALRRAFVSWVHKSFSKRSKMPVDHALQDALTDKFACN